MYKTQTLEYLAAMNIRPWVERSSASSVHVMVVSNNMTPQELSLLNQLQWFCNSLIDETSSFKIITHEVAIAKKIIHDKLPDGSIYITTELVEPFSILLRDLLEHPSAKKQLYCQ